MSSYDSSQGTQLCKILEKKAGETKDIVNIDILKKLVEEEHPINMTDRGARVRIETLFVLYRSLLYILGLVWLTDKNKIVAVYRVLSAIRPESLCARLESDL